MRRPRWTFLKSLACAGVLIACGEEIEESAADAAPEVALASDPPDHEQSALAGAERISTMAGLAAHRERIEAAAARADARFTSKRKAAAARVSVLAGAAQ